MIDVSSAAGKIARAARDQRQFGPETMRVKLLQMQIPSETRDRGSFRMARR